MAIPITPITLNDLTLATLDGTGVFDVLMRANKAHLEAEYSKNRIKGSEYATVYLGSLEAVLNSALQFLLQKDKIALEAQLIEQQILLAQVEVIKANAQVAQTEAQTELVRQQTANALAELEIIRANALKIPAEMDHLQAQTLMVNQQTSNVAAEALNIPKQGALIDAQALNTSKQAALVEKEILVKTEQVLIAKEELKVAVAKLLNLPKEGILLDKQALDIVAKTSMTDQQKANLVLEADNIPKQGAVLVSQKCKLDAEFDLLKTTNLKSAEEQALLAWKTTTEKAQTTALGVDDNSVIGKQKGLYTAQTDGFKRDAEQKAADLMAKTWMARRTTDEATVADGVNMLNDAAVGRAVNKLLSGVGA